jgi:hypothetical protein
MRERHNPPSSSDLGEHYMQYTGTQSDDYEIGSEQTISLPETVKNFEVALKTILRRVTYSHPGASPRHMNIPCANDEKANHLYTTELRNIKLHWMLVCLEIRAIFMSFGLCVGCLSKPNSIKSLKDSGLGKLFKNKS